jgi:hypothetical protein
MKHVRLISGVVPKKGNAQQELICETVHTIAGIVRSKGGNAPIIFYIDDKCDIPTPPQ